MHNFMYFFGADALGRSMIARLIIATQNTRYKKYKKLFKFHILIYNKFSSRDLNEMTYIYTND